MPSLRIRTIFTNLKLFGPFAYVLLAQLLFCALYLDDEGLGSCQ